MLQFSRMKEKKKSQKESPKGKGVQVKIKINLRNILLIVFLLLFILPAILSFIDLKGGESKVELSQALSDLKSEKIKKVTIQEDKLLLDYKEGGLKYTTKEPTDSFTSLLEKVNLDPTKVNYTIADSTLTKAFGSILGTVLPILLMIGAFYFIFKLQSRGAQDIFSFGRSKAKLFAKGKQDITFKDVAGVDDAKKELEEVVDFLKNPAKYRKIGARTPKGVLLFGPSGVGKTLLAKAVAGEANVPFFSMAGSEFMEMLVGVGASRVRDLFSNAKASAPSIIFIDEIDAIGRQRGRGLMGGHDEREQTLNQILVEMDGFTPNDNVLVMAASVVGDTPILIEENGGKELLPIGEFVDKFYKNQKQEGEIEISEVKCLGFDRKISKEEIVSKKLYFGNSAFKRVRAVFRHRVNEIYKVEYLGGEIRSTGNHSLFVRSKLGIETKAVSELEPGDVLIDIPFKTNGINKGLRDIRAHKFSENWSLSLKLWDQKKEDYWLDKYEYAIKSVGSGMSQTVIGGQIGVSQSTVGNWARGRYMPQAISRKLFKSDVKKLPEEIKVTPDLCRLLGFYVAEGYSRWGVDFCFSVKEEEVINDTIELMKSVFGLLPRIRHITSGAVNLVYYSTPVGEFFSRFCGKGAHHKHIPQFLFEAPYIYFKEFLRGVWLGDGYEDKRGRGELTTVSKRLALEINWLARMHGVKTYLGGFMTKEGRQIKGGKPLKAGYAWRVGWGKAANPFVSYKMEKTAPAKRAIVKRVTKTPFKGFVYDLCGVDNEAFFGGESPILLHNTNRGDLLDPALLRPGRFDRRVTLDMPDKEGRLAILTIHAKGKKFGKGINWLKIADRTVGFSGADLENMLNEAAITAARNGKDAIGMLDLEESATKVKLGPAKKKIQTQEDRNITAYHEAGHALVSHILPKTDPVQRISIVARGMSLGHTEISPNGDRTHETKTRLIQAITSMLGGRAAEQIVFNELTAGASNDIKVATRYAKAMVVDFGMSVLGPVNLGANSEMGDFGNMEWYEGPQISPAMQEKVDNEVSKIIEHAYKEAEIIIKKNRKTLDAIVKRLLEKETLDKDEFEKIVGKKNE